MPVYLQGLLRRTAELTPSRRLIFYPLGDPSTSFELDYSELYTQAKLKSSIIRSLEGFKERSPVILHLDDHSDFVLWFWAVLLANGLPVASSPLSQDEYHRQSQVQHLSTLLESPICITRERSKGPFERHFGRLLLTVESLLVMNQSSSSAIPLGCCEETYGSDGLAMLMLTSGSTGNAKAVCLTHRQVIAAVTGKANVRQLPSDQAFLNWIGLDHVASLVEIHIQALFLGVDQVHVHAQDIVSSPVIFLDLLSRHGVSRSFAPNSFIAKLISTLQSDQTPSGQGWDLSRLTVLASGGEANDIETCAAASALLAKYGAPRNVITPGFGMTETCAGAIFNLNCPEYDVQSQLVFASLGKCMTGIEMRITTPADGGHLVLIAPANTAGDLEVRGKVVFQGYYRNEEATREAFTADGWFRTGDQAIIDSEGNLRLLGRVKDVININGVKISATVVQASIERAVGARTSRVISFASRAIKASTEQITVAFVPTEWPMRTDDMAEICDLIIQACIICTGSRPFVFSLADESLLPKSTLGKISLTKMGSFFESGVFDESIRVHNLTLEKYRSSKLSLPGNEAEACLLDDVGKISSGGLATAGVDTPFFEIGFTSMDLIRLKRQIDGRLQLDIPIITFMRNPTVRSLASALRDLDPTNKPSSAQPGTTYDPVVPFLSSGSKTPLWLIHPGVGEVLVFVGLTQHLIDDDRPVYALRARGFEEGQSRFASIPETVEAYLAAIQQRQPQGPYAIAGYSYGAMLAFEVAKRLENQNQGSVRFLGSFNLPPHIKPRMRQLNWNLCLLHLAYFLGLVSQAYAHDIEDRFSGMARLDAMALVLGVADKERLVALGLNEAGLASWAEVAFGLQSMAVDYEPQGMVKNIDVFHAIPLKAAAKSREDWLQNHLAKWKDFCETKPRFHQVGGEHYTMIGPGHVVGFSKTLKEALEARGL
ncbi:hypothetical protein DL769_001931 [Monosporascus sp. CRB-8-3]|nr:hypothetical protein DL769_001931 [Monosporascus sp. CRB-8-3]